MNEHAAIDHLERVLGERRSFSIGDSISKGFDIWKGDMGTFIGFGMIYFILSMGLGVIPVLGQIISSLLVGPALSLGGAIYAYRIFTDEQREFGNFFDGFSHWKQIIIVSTITIFGAFLFLIPIIFSFGMEAFLNGGENFEVADFENFALSSASIVMMIVSVLILIYLGVCFSYGVYFVGFFELDAITALKYSFKFVSRQWIWVFLFSIVAAICSISGVILLVFGIIITFPMIFAMQYSAFEEMTGVEEYYRGPESTSDVNIDDMFG